ncbi:MAG: efflux transporter outer membrane subunit [Legionellales bacterium]
MKPYLAYGILILLLTLTGCALGPRYVPPTVSIPSSWIEGGKHQRAATNNEAWWRNFHDPLLNELIEQQAVYNLNLKTAQARVETARAEYAIASAQLFPAANIVGMPPTGTGVALNQLIALTTTIDPDLFGKIRENKQLTQANLNGSEANRDFTLINLYAEIASSYLELREAQAKNRLQRNSISRNRQTLHFVKSRYKAGYANYMNVAQQEGLIDTQLAELELNQAHMTTVLYKIELLTGNNPGLLAKKLLAPKPVPQTTQNISLGIPSALLRRRGDVIAAEQQVAAAHATIRIALANLAPQVNIGWLLGWQTQTLASNLFALQHPQSTLFSTIAAPLFNLGLYRTVGLRKREKILAVLQYQMTVLQALHEVEIQYNYYQHYLKSISHLQRAVAQKRLVLKLATDSYQKGVSDFNNVLRSEEELSHAEFSYLQNTVMLQKVKINLYKALGGNNQGEK